MSITHGDWAAPVTIAVPSETLTDGASPTAHTLTDERDLFVIHAVLLHTGKVLWFCGHVEDAHYALVSYVFDPSAPTSPLTRVPFPRLSPARARAGGHTGSLFHADLFCSHYVQLPDGRILLVGGSDPDYVAHSSVGDRYIAIFDPTTIPPTWAMAATGATPNRMAHGRWYPTAVLLEDGRVMIVSGRQGAPLPSSGSGVVQQVEILSPPNYAASTLTGADKELPIYPGLHLAPNGRVYYTHTTWGHEVPPPANTFSIQVPAIGTPQTASWTNHPPPNQPRREEGMSVLLPPAQDGKILVIGGSTALNASGDPIRTHGGDFHHLTSGSDYDNPGRDPYKAEIFDTNTNTWSPASGAGSVPDLAHPRINGHCVILPNKKVLILGGHGSHKWDAQRHTPASDGDPSLPCEIYDPVANTFTTVASLTHPRMYHAAALLLPDGSVIVAGGADPSDLEPAPDNVPWATSTFSYGAWTGPKYGPTGGGDIFLNRKDYEIYRPPYFWPLGTPRIQVVGLERASTSVFQVTYGETLRLVTDDDAAVTAVGIMRPGAATHHTDSEQRYVDLDIPPSSPLHVTFPTDRNLAPPGYYMLWAVANGRPCQHAAWIHLV